MHIIHIILCYVKQRVRSCICANLSQNEPQNKLSHNISVIIFTKHSLCKQTYKFLIQHYTVCFPLTYFRISYNWYKYLHQQESSVLILNRRNVSSQYAASLYVSPRQVQLVQHLGQKNQKAHQGMQVSHDTHWLVHLCSEKENLIGTVHDLENAIMVLWQKYEIWWSYTDLWQWPGHYRNVLLSTICQLGYIQNTQWTGNWTCFHNLVRVRGIPLSWAS